jgi:hypothetical protein
VKQLILFALWWFAAGCIVGLGINALGGPNAVIWCGGVNAIIGLVGLALALRQEQARAAFYGEGEGGGIALALLIGLPVSIILVGLIWVVMGWAGWRP